MLLAGRAIAITSTVTLPQQPAAGDLVYQPLGGNGMTSPFAAYVVDDHQVTGDVSGGAAALLVNMDPQFCSLISYVQILVQQVASADADFRVAVEGPDSPRFSDSGLIPAISKTISGATLERTWLPPATILPGGARAPTLTLQMLNVDADEYLLSMLIYLFNINVRETTPMGPLLWARGAT